MGSVSDTYDPMPASKPGEKTPKNIGLCKILTPFGGSPPPYTLAVGWDGARRRGAVPSHACLYIIYVQTGAAPSHSQIDFKLEKIWDVTRHRLAETPKCFYKGSVPSAFFSAGGTLFQG